jgi:hypothetical protein
LDFRRHLSLIFAPMVPFDVRKTRYPFFRITLHLIRGVSRWCLGGVSGLKGFARTPPPLKG